MEPATHTTERAPTRTAVRRAVAAALLAFVLFSIHAALFGSWVIDDAGISFTYARNLAEGHGLVAQPAAPPTEGFSNALWTLLLAATQSLGLFHPAWTPKVLAGILVLISFLLLSLALVGGAGRSAVAVGLALAATAASTPFVVWSVSGLENPLSVCLVSGLVALSLRVTLRHRTTGHEAVVLGLLTFLLFLTRPDGIVFLPIPAFALALSGRERLRRNALLYGLAFLAPWILVTAARLVYFGDVLPNTYYAKRGPGWRETLRLVDGLGPALAGTLFVGGVALVVAVSVALASLLGRRLASRAEGHAALFVLGTYFLTAYADFKALPTDWMPEYRFGTPLYLLGPLLLMEAVGRFRTGGTRGRRHAAARAAALVCLVAAGLYSWQHSLAFRRQPTVPFADIRRLSTTLDRFAHQLGVDRATILLPDIGGSLWENRFEVVDLAGLTDRTLGRKLRSDRDGFLRYVLDRHPDIVWVHGYWRDLADLASAADFTRRYTALSARPILGRADGVLYVERGLLQAPDGE